jgi:PTS system mannose-specific IIB component/fructoselysine and glucoselysine-specific PTS system IIB component
VVVLFRVDERLIHGQVVIAWGSQLRPDLYVIVDEDLATSAWEQDLYRLSLPEGTTAQFVTVAEAIQLVPEWIDAPQTRVALLTRDLRTMVELAEEGLLADLAVNLGGIHDGPGRTKVSSYLHLDEGDRARIQRLTDLGVSVTGRDLPDASAVTLASLLRE